MSKAPAVDYALKIIEFFSDSNEDLGISDISNGLNINKNAISRVFDSLLEQICKFCQVKRFSMIL